MLSSFFSPRSLIFVCYRDHSGFIDYNEFKTVFSANLGPDAIPFNFDSDWIKLFLGKKDGTHVLGCMFIPFAGDSLLTSLQITNSRSL